MERKTTPDWSHWNACDLLQVWEAVALSINRDPSTITDYRKRLSNGRSGRPKWLYGGGEEFDRRMDLLKRAFDRDASQFVQPRDIYYAFKHLEERDVLPDKIRQFFIDKGLAVPAEWIAPIEPETTEELPEPAFVPPTGANDAWKLRARELFLKMAAGSPLNKAQLADKIADQLHSEEIKGRGGKRISGATVLRQALQNIPKP